jgi:hypothetical protein
VVRGKFRLFNPLPPLSGVRRQNESPNPAHPCLKLLGRQVTLATWGDTLSQPLRGRF